MKRFGRYEIVEELGRGAMGVVYKAADPTIGRLVALKVLSLQAPSAPGMPDTQDIFMREARAAGRLTHPSIVTIHDAFEDPETQSSCIVMELVAGQTLEKKVLSGSHFSLEETLEIVRQVAEALDYAHRSEVTHRDLKPANILLSEDGRAKLTDFGIAKIMAREGALRTAALMGTPSYMSPEQVTGKDVDTRSDLFSLGIIFYLMLTGQKPFSGDTAAVLFKIVYEDPVSPRKLNPELPRGCEYLVLRLLVKDRDKRYASARRFLDDLEDVRAGRAPRSEAELPLSELLVGERTVMLARDATGPTGEITRVPKGKIPWIAAGGALMVLLAGALGGWTYRHSKIASPTAAPSRLPSPAAPQTKDTSPATTAPQPSLSSPSATPTGGEYSAASGKNRSQNAGTAPGQALSRKALTPAVAESIKPVAQPTAAAAPPGPQASPAAPNVAPPIPRGTTAPSALTPAGKPVVVPGMIQFLCRHELKEGKLSVSDGTQIFFQRDLKGKKKRLLGLKTLGYQGLLSNALAVPGAAHDLTVRVTSAEEGIDLSNTITFPPPAGSLPVLDVVVKRDGVQINWRVSAPPKP